MSHLLETYWFYSKITFSLSCFICKYFSKKVRAGAGNQNKMIESTVFKDTPFYMCIFICPFIFVLIHFEHCGIKPGYNTGLFL